MCIHKTFKETPLRSRNVFPSTLWCKKRKKMKCNNNQNSPDILLHNKCPHYWHKRPHYWHHLRRLDHRCLCQILISVLYRHLACYLIKKIKTINFRFEGKNNKWRAYKINGCSTKALVDISLFFSYKNTLLSYFTKSTFVKVIFGHLNISLKAVTF